MMEDKAKEMRECSFKPMISGMSSAIASCRRSQFKKESGVNSQSSGATEKYSPGRRKRTTMSPSEFYEHEEQFKKQKAAWADAKYKEHIGNLKRMAL